MMTLQNVSIFFWLHFSLAVIVPDIENLSSLVLSNVNVYVMTTMWRALNQRGLRRVYAQSLI